MPLVVDSDAQPRFLWSFLSFWATFPQLSDFFCFQYLAHKTHWRTTLGILKLHCCKSLCCLGVYFPPLLLRGTPPQGDPPVKKYENPGPLFLSGQPLRNSILIGVLFCDQLLSMGLCLKSELLALLFLFTLPTCLASSGSTSLNNNLYNLLLRNPT